MKNNHKINVLFIASEAAPIIKVGGLGDVAGSLPKALKSLLPDQISGNEIDVRLVIPFHSLINQKLNEIQLISSFFVKNNQGDIPARVFQTKVDDVIVYLVEGGSILTDKNVYSSNPEYDAKKYIFFSIAALEFVKNINWQIDIVHANDWHTAIALYELKLRHPSDSFFIKTKSVLSMHNIPYMGSNSETTLNDFGIPKCPCSILPEWAKSIPLPIGMYAADFLLTVSPTYAKEILTPDYGCGLQEYFNYRKNTLAGILNGLDESKWDPKTDNAIHTTFNVEHLDKRIKNKLALQTEFGLEKNRSIPLFIMITRMDQQKGVDLAIHALRLISNYSWQAIFLGTGDPVLESTCRSLEVEMPDKVKAAIRFDLNLSRRMYAGGDVILIPSRYEPCGLTQMIGMRYGCVPLARSTGGLQDTVFENEKSKINNGFLFKDTDPEDMSKALIRAINLYNQAEQWKTLQVNGMLTDFSWEKSALEYANIYLELIKEQNEN